MKGSRRWGAWVGVLSVLAAGCAVKRIENGVYYSSKGYRVAIPGPEWTPVNGGPADLELRHRAGAASMAVNAVCEGPAPRRTPEVLGRQLLIGLRDQHVIEHATAEVAGHPASRLVVDGRLDGAHGRVRIDSVMLQDGRCLYDFLSVAAPGASDAIRDDFGRFVDSFRTE